MVDPGLLPTVNAPADPFAPAAFHTGVFVVLVDRTQPLMLVVAFGLIARLVRVWVSCTDADAFAEPVQREPVMLPSKYAPGVLACSTSAESAYSCSPTVVEENITPGRSKVVSAAVVDVRVTLVHVFAGMDTTVGPVDCAKVRFPPLLAKLVVRVTFPPVVRYTIMDHEYVPGPVADAMVYMLFAAPVFETVYVWEAVPVKRFAVVDVSVFPESVPQLLVVSASGLYTQLVRPMAEDVLLNTGASAYVHMSVVGLTDAGAGDGVETITA